MAVLPMGVDTTQSTGIGAVYEVCFVGAGVNDEPEVIRVWATSRELAVALATRKIDAGVVLTKVLVRLFVARMSE